MSTQLIRINEELFSENSANLKTAVEAFVPSEFEFQDTNGVARADTYRSEVLDVYKQAAIDLSKALEQYKQLLQKDYATLQAVAERIRSADTSGSSQNRGYTM